jgi:hypothetical protein
MNTPDACMQQQRLCLSVCEERKYLIAMYFPPPFGHFPPPPFCQKKIKKIKKKIPGAGTL